MADKITKNTLLLNKQKKELQEQLKQAKRDYAILEEKYNALQIALDQSEARYELLQQGATLVYLDQEQRITNIIPIEPYFNSTFKQVIPLELEKALGSKLYNAFRFGKLENGNVVIDKELYNKYKGAILL